MTVPKTAWVGEMVSALSIPSLAYEETSWRATLIPIDSRLDQLNGSKGAAGVSTLSTLLVEAAATALLVADADEPAVPLVRPVNVLYALMMVGTYLMAKDMSEAMEPKSSCRALAIRLRASVMAKSSFV